MLFEFELRSMALVVISQYVIHDAEDFFAPDFNELLLRVLPQARYSRPPQGPLWAKAHTLPRSVPVYGGCACANEICGNSSDESDSYDPIIGAEKQHGGENHENHADCAKNIDQHLRRARSSFSYFSCRSS